MTASVPERAWPRLGSPARFAGLRHFRTLIGATLLLGASPAAAELGATVSAFSDHRFRGYSLSAGRPVALLDFAYDDPSGLYAAASASVVASRDGVRPLGLQANIGYAKTIGSGLTLDVGAVHYRYSEYSGSDHSRDYSEIYVGLSHKWISSRVYFSPHYFDAGTRTVYGEVNASFSPADEWNLEGHAGTLVHLSSRPGAYIWRTEFDWRAGVSREIGRASLHLALSGGGPGPDHYYGRPHHRTALVAGVSFAL